MVPVAWNTRSLLSARNVLLEGLNTFGTLDTAVVAHERRADAHALHDLPPVSIETLVDRRIKSPVLLIKELLRHYLRAQAGSLCLALHEPPGVAVTPMDSLSANGFTALTDALLSTYRNEAFRLNAFLSRHEDPTEYADYILSTLVGRAAGVTGKWFRHAGRPLHSLGRSRR
jgi:hypothetical protein